MAKLYLGTREVTPALKVGSGSSTGMGVPDYTNGTTLATSTLHTMPSNGWISSSGSVRLNANTGKQILGGGALGMVPVESGQVVYISGMAATFYPCK